MLRRARAVLLTAVFWAFAWMPVGAVLGFIEYRRGPVFTLLPPQPEFLWDTISAVMLDWGLLGAVNGALFAILLAIVERGATIATLSPARVAILGAVGTLVLPGLTLLAAVIVLGPSDLYVRLLPMLSILALGAACAATMFFIARRAETRTHGAPAA